MDKITKDDARIKRVQVSIRKHGARPDALIEVLHVVQDVFGHLPKEIMRFVGTELKIPASRIYGVATFYHFFSLKPKGERNCLVCTGTACHVKGSRALLLAIERDLGLKAGDSTPDGRLSVQTARCVGCCGLAPVVALDHELMARATPEDLVAKLKAIVEPSGAPV